MLYMPDSSSCSNHVPPPLFSTGGGGLQACFPCHAAMKTEGLLVIQRPSCESFSFFDWSDFPVVRQQAAFDDVPSCAPLMANEDYASTSCGGGAGDIGLSPSSSPPFNSLRSASTKSSVMPNSSSSSSSNNNNNQRRRVSFADNIQVRTHSIVLGDHPCCTLLPLTLGWEYNDETTTGLSLRNAGYSSQERQHQHCRGPTIRRRTYLERKDILKRVSGMTDAEIKHIVTTNLHAMVTISHNLCTLSANL
jgi:hypothetical protein